MHETFWMLLTDPAHIEVELFLMAVFDGVVGSILFPWIKRRLKHHQGDDKKIEKLEKEVRRLSDAVKLLSERKG